MCISALLMFPVEGPACCCHCSHTFVRWNEYQGVGGCDGAVSMSGKGALKLPGAQGGAMGVLGGWVLWGNCAVCLDADWPGLGGLVAGWARLTRSSPNESDSLSDSGIWQSLNGARTGCAHFNSFTGNEVSSNFTSWEISNHWWAASQTGILWIPVHNQQRS